MTGGESKAVSFENQGVSTSLNKRQKRHTEPFDLNGTQSSVLRPQSSNLSPDNFEQVCADLLREGHLVKFRAPGDSMYPTICDGDLITVAPINPSDVVMEDIILYRHQSGVVAHRVIDIEAHQPSVLSPQHCFTLRGDAAINDDFPVHSNQILGKVVALERNGRLVDPYCLRIKLLYKSRRLAVRLKRVFFGHPN